MIQPDLLLAMGAKLSRADAVVTAEKLQTSADRFGISTKLRVAHWLAQLVAESHLVPIDENLNYSAKRLRQVWPNRFPTVSHARPYEWNPPALGEFVYGARMGNTEPGDGYKYRGRGFIQLTGRANYRTYGRIIGFDLEGNPGLLSQIGISALVAGAYWKDRGCSSRADRDDLEAVTRAINGGLNGLEHRETALKKAKQYLKI
jgi:putative chitinase